jgi:NitT/TauT family transport system substrate-binding protein
MRALIAISVLLAAGSCGKKNPGGNRVRVAGTGRAAAAYLPLFVAGPAGCMNREGIQMQLEETGGAPKSLEALLGGSVDVAAIDYLALLNVARHGQPVRGFVLMTKLPGFAAIVAPKASAPIHKIEDLRGRTIGVSAPGTGYHLVLNYVLLRHGIKPEEVSVVGVGSGPSLAAALERGVVDIGLGAGLTIGYLEQRHPDLTYVFDTRTVASTKAALGTDEVAYFLLCAREGWLKTQSRTARQLASAMQCALTWVQDHSPQQIRKVLPDSSLTPDAETDYKWITAAKNTLAMDGRMTSEAHASAVRILGSAESAKLKQEELFTNEFLRP